MDVTLASNAQTMMMMMIFALLPMLGLLPARNAGDGWRS